MRITRLSVVWSKRLHSRYVDLSFAAPLPLFDVFLRMVALREGGRGTVMYLSKMLEVCYGKDVEIKVPSPPEKS
jgi:hypothetical protein